MAADDYKLPDRGGSIVVEGRERLSISGVIDVISFDEKEILAETAEGELLVTGDDLHVERLSLEIGELAITGRIDSLEYKGDSARKGSIWSKLF